MFGGKKEKALQDELYTIKKQIAEYSDELKEDSVQMTVSRVQMEENIEILEEKLECVGELAEESCRTGKELYIAMQLYMRRVKEKRCGIECFGAYPRSTLPIGSDARRQQESEGLSSHHASLCSGQLLFRKHPTIHRSVLLHRMPPMVLRK